MNIATSVTVFQDAVGMRLSVTYSEVDDQGKIIADNKRVNRVVTDASVKALGNQLIEYAQSFVDAQAE